VNLSLVEMLGALIYSTGMTPKERLQMTPEEAFKVVKGETIQNHVRYLEIFVSGDTDDMVDAIIPVIRYKRN